MSRIRNIRAMAMQNAAARLLAERSESDTKRQEASAPVSPEERAKFDNERRETLGTIDDTRAALKKSGNAAMTGIWLGWVPLLGAALSIPQRSHINSAVKKIKAFRRQNPGLAYVTRDIENQTKRARTNATIGLVAGILPIYGSMTATVAYLSQQSALTAIDRVRDLVNRHGATPDEKTMDNFTQRVEWAQNFRAI